MISTNTNFVFSYSGNMTNIYFPKEKIVLKHRGIWRNQIRKNDKFGTNSITNYPG